MTRGQVLDPITALQNIFLSHPQPDPAPFNREVAGSTHTRSTASNLEQVANLLRAQANSTSYPQQDGK